MLCGVILNWSRLTRMLAIGRSPLDRDRRLWLSARALIVQQRVGCNLWLSTPGAVLKRRATVSRVNKPIRSRFREHEPVCLVAGLEHSHSIIGFFRGAGDDLPGLKAMLIEKRALLEHADRCRRIADEIEHARAAKRLTAMAHEYEARAARFGDENGNRKEPRWRRFDGL